MTTKPMRVDGVDISHHQAGSLDLAGAKKQGLKWLYHKATEGTTYKDPNYTKRRAEAKKAGLPFGAYHFARPSATDAVAEAKFFLSVAKPVPGDLRPMLDLETDEGMSLAAIRKWAKAFIDEVNRQTGHRPVVYTPFDLGPYDDGCLIWRARYNNTNTPPTLPWDIWQFSNGVYGVPNSITGIGHCDLNVMKDGVTVKDMLLPAKEVKPPKKKTARLKFGHVSMQFNDTSAMHTADIEKVFARGYDVITGTEAGPGSGNTNEELVRCAAKYGYVINMPARGGYDTWCAVKKTLVVGKIEKGAIHALDSGTHYGLPPHRFGNKGVVWLAWNMGPTYGRLGVAAIHTVTHGSVREHPELKDRLDTVYATKMEEWRLSQPAEQECFVGGDFNRQDQRGDVFMGKAQFLSGWDETKKHDNTGHGNIDVIAREKGSKRVRCVSITALDDSEFFLNTDHFLVEAVYEITAL